MSKKVYCSNCKYKTWVREQPLLSPVMITSRCKHPDSVYSFDTIDCIVYKLSTTVEFNHENNCKNFKEANLIDLLIRPFKILFAPWD